MICDACEAAKTNPFSGLLTAGCHQCAVRLLSNQPSFVREKHYAGIRNEQQRTTLMHEVGAEYKRRVNLAQAIRRPLVLREVA